MKKLFLFTLMAFAIFSGCYYNGQAGSGQKIGTIVKVSQEGVLFNTFEAQLIRGGMNGGSGAFGVQPFDFTIEDPTLLKACEGYMQSNVEVVVTYRKPVIGGCGTTESGAFAVSVKPVK